MPSIINSTERIIENYKQALYTDNSYVYRVTCTLHNPETEFEIQPRFFVGMVIEQNFATNIMDTIEVSMMFEIDDFIRVINNMQNLEISIILTPVDIFYLYTQPRQEPVKLNYVVYTDDRTSPAEKYNIQKFGQSDLSTGETVPEHTSQFGHLQSLTLHCYNKKAYELRQKEYNAITEKVSVEDMIHWSGTKIEIDDIKINCIKPDNSMKYDNFIIPPGIKFGGLLPYVQERYGIYSKGFCHYYTNDTYYVFPPFDLEPGRAPEQNVLNLILGPDSYFGGLPSYHSWIEENLYMVTTSVPTIQELGSQGAENNGNVITATNADQVKDHAAELKEGGKLVRDASNITVLARQNEKGDMRSKVQNINYIGETSNQFSALSLLASSNGAAMTSTWLRAEPYALSPGMDVIYHYDAEQMIYKTRKGKLLGVTYTSQNSNSQDLQPFISFNATMNIFLEPDYKNEEESQFLDYT